MARMAIDLDYFKSANDRQCHLVGDHVIRAFTDIMPREFGAIGRIGLGCRQLPAQWEGPASAGRQTWHSLPTNTRLRQKFRSPKSPSHVGNHR
ncbi:GGDEF domain-containing protein [Methylorubrum extorquens]|uniref:GGDEF domain-containing protein n=1 Tax=Methylorubrum extorquens TaxID=408 RepID=UPI0011BE1FEA